eukprot:c19220_g1_i2.p1 GENE.c19220_g1_i2~~c19220_g1_i2.p1  ORF type:complete len:480 (-),score=121.74 c19220_g1_i2:54-1493(-)
MVCLLNESISTIATPPKRRVAAIHPLGVALARIPDRSRAKFYESSLPAVLCVLHKSESHEEEQDSGDDETQPTEGESAKQRKKRKSQDSREDFKIQILTSCTRLCSIVANKTDKTLVDAHWLGGYLLQVLGIAQSWYGLREHDIYSRILKPAHKLGLTNVVWLSRANQAKQLLSNPYPHHLAAGFKALAMGVVVRDKPTSFPAVYSGTFLYNSLAASLLVPCLESGVNAPGADAVLLLERWLPHVHRPIEDVDKVIAKALAAHLLTIFDDETRRRVFGLILDVSRISSDPSDTLTVFEALLRDDAIHPTIRGLVIGQLRTHILQELRSANSESDSKNFPAVFVSARVRDLLCDILMGCGGEQGLSVTERLQQFTVEIDLVNPALNTLRFLLLTQLPNQHAHDMVHDKAFLTRLLNGWLSPTHTILINAATHKDVVHSHDGPGLGLMMLLSVVERVKELVEAKLNNTQAPPLPSQASKQE